MAVAGAIRTGDEPGGRRPRPGTARRRARGGRVLAARPPGPPGPQAAGGRRADRRDQGALGAADRRSPLLWAHFEAYTEALAAARELRGPAALADADRTGPAHRTVARRRGHRRRAAPCRTTARSLTGPARLSEQLSLERAGRADERLVRQAMETVAAADAVWSALPARIDLLAAEAQRVRSLAHSVGVRPGEHPSGDDLEQLIEELRGCAPRWSPTRWPSGWPAPGSRRPAADTRRYERAGRRAGGHPPRGGGRAAGARRRRAPAAAAAGRAVPRRPHPDRGPAARGRGAGEDRGLRGARGQRPGRRAARTARPRPSSSPGPRSGTGCRRCWTAWRSAPTRSCSGPGSR